MTCRLILIKIQKARAFVPSLFLLQAEFFKYRCQNLFYRAFLQGIAKVVAFNNL